MRYKFCPECGTRLVERQAGDEGKVPYCEACSKYWFDSFGSCSIVLVANEFQEIALLGQRYLSKKYKNFVSGYIVPGETAEDTAIREVKEEIGVTLERLETVGTYWFREKELLMHGFIGYTKKCDFQISKEVNTAEWVSASEVAKMIFPEAPGNAQYAVYKAFMERLRY